MNDALKKCAIVGSPNVGKSSLFNILTGSNQNVSNWSGVTVSKKTGTFKHNNQEYIFHPEINKALEKVEKNNVFNSLFLLFC